MAPELQPTPPPAEVKFSFSPGESAALDIVNAHVKSVIDLMKHLTTLSAGSIVVIATFQDRMKSAHWVWTLSVAIVSMLLCIGVALKVCYDLLYHDARSVAARVTILSGNLTREYAEKYLSEGKRAAKNLATMNRTVLATDWLFVVGLALLVMFILRNVLPW